MIDRKIKQTDGRYIGKKESLLKGDLHLMSACYSLIVLSH